MEYFVGSLTTFIILYLVTKLLSFNNFSDELPVLRQSSVHEIVKPLIPEETKIRPKPIINRQSRKHEDRTNVRVIIMDNQAYWIRDNVFYTAELNGQEIQKETTKAVDIMTMDKVQLDKMLFIMDKLREGSENDRGSTGNQ